MTEDVAEETVEETTGETVEETVEETAGDWRASIEDEDIRKTAERFASPTDAVKAVMDLRKRESNSIRIPGKDASDEDRASYRKALGVPDDVNGYEFVAPEGREPTEAEMAFQKSAAEAFYEHNISTEAAKGLVEWFNGVTAKALQDQIDADKEYATETEAALRKEWPGAEYDKNREIAQRAAQKIFGADINEIRNIETKDGRFVLDHPSFVKMFAQYGREMEEGTLGGAMSEADMDGLDKEIDDLQDQIDKAMASGDRTKANNLYQKQQELYRKKVGSAPIVGAQGRTV